MVLIEQCHQKLDAMGVQVHREPGAQALIAQTSVGQVRLKAPRSGEVRINALAQEAIANQEMFRGAAAWHDKRSGKTLACISLPLFLDFLAASNGQEVTKEAAMSSAGVTFRNWLSGLAQRVRHCFPRDVSEQIRCVLSAHDPKRMVVLAPGLRINARFGTKTANVSTAFWASAKGCEWGEAPVGITHRAGHKVDVVVLPLEHLLGLQEKAQAALTKNGL